MTEIEIRRKVAEGIFEQGLLDRKIVSGGLSAIQYATQVRITNEMLTAIPNATRSDAYDIACDLFAIAGFEVIE